MACSYIADFGKIFNRTEKFFKKRDFLGPFFLSLVVFFLLLGCDASSPSQALSKEQLLYTFAKAWENQQCPPSLFSEEVFLSFGKIQGRFSRSQSMGLLRKHLSSLSEPALIRETVEERYAIFQQSGFRNGTLKNLLLISFQLQPQGWMIDRVEEE